MSVSRIASRYSKSLIESARDNGKLEAVKADMETVLATCEESKELRNLLKNPIIKASGKRAVLAKVFSKTDGMTQDFIAYLVEKRRESELATIAAQYIGLYNQLKGISSATVITAAALSQETMSQMKKYVSVLLQKNDVELNNKVDAAIIGGVIIRHEDKLLDKSVSKELREIRKTLIYN